MGEDTYRTIAEPAEAVIRERGSRFLAYAYPVGSQDEIKQKLDALRKEYYDATHHCYAWRLGPKGESSRINDDGEPSGTAGKPIMGQLLSNELTYLLVVVIRYFGGTKLGVPGLISAYRQAAAEVIGASEIVEKTVDVDFTIRFSYMVMNDVMKVIKDMSPRIVSQNFDNLCTMQLSVRAGDWPAMRQRLVKVEGLGLDEEQPQE